MHLLAGQGGIICALLCTSDCLHPRHSLVPCMKQNTSAFAFSAIAGKLYFTRGVPEGNWLPQGLVPPAKPAANPAAKPCAKLSAKSASKPAAQVAAKPAAGEPIQPLLSMCRSSESNTPTRKSGTQSPSLSRAEHASQQAVFQLNLWFICPRVCMPCFVSPVLCIVIEGGGGIRSGSPSGADQL